MYIHLRFLTVVDEVFSLFLEVEERPKASPVEIMNILCMPCIPAGLITGWLTL